VSRADRRLSHTRHLLHAPDPWPRRRREAVSGHPADANRSRTITIQRQLARLDLREVRMSESSLLQEGGPRVYQGTIRGPVVVWLSGPAGGRATTAVQGRTQLCSRWPGRYYLAWFAAVELGLAFAGTPASRALSVSLGAGPRSAGEARGEIARSRGPRRRRSVADAFTDLTAASRTSCSSRGFTNTVSRPRQDAQPGLGEAPDHQVARA